MNFIYKLMLLMSFSFFGYSLTQEEIDEGVSKKVTEIFSSINSNWEYVYSNEEGTAVIAYIDSLFWEVTTEYSALSLRLKNPNCNIVDALQELPKNKGLLDCTVAQTTAIILCLLDLLGEEKFNIYIDKLKEATKLDFSDGKFFILISQVVLAEGSIPGFTYITNHEDYSRVKAVGACSGYNGYIFSDRTFISFSPLHLKEAQSVEKVQRILFEDMMSDKDVSCSERYVEIKQLYENNFDAFLKHINERQKSKKILHFNVDSINKLISRSR